ncbi:MAG: hypothetical protein ACFB4I_16875 [Cyanophyceae cyanobacterium]
MNVLLPRFLKTAYRKEPVSSFILIVGAVDAVIGGVGGRWSLLTVGVTTTLIAVVLRRWQVQKAQTVTQEARHFLPPSSSSNPLPVLTKDRKWR